MRPFEAETAGKPEYEWRVYGDIPLSAVTKITLAKYRMRYHELIEGPYQDNSGVTVVPDAKDSETHFWIKDGDRVVGGFMLMKNRDALNLHISLNDGEIGKGYGQIAYHHGQKVADARGLSFEPSPLLTGYSYRAWKRFKPEAVADYYQEEEIARFGETWLDPRFYDPEDR